jgi:hypothetical protein
MKVAHSVSLALMAKALRIWMRLAEDRAEELEAVKKELAAIKKNTVASEANTYRIGSDGLDGEDGEDGKNGIDGKHGEPGIDGNPGAPGEPGQKGPCGDAPKFQWDGSRLRVQKPDGTWGHWVDLAGLPGDRGQRGMRRSAGNAMPFDLDNLPIADSAIPLDGMPVIQGGELRDASLGQLSQWFSLSLGGVNFEVLTIDGEIITINGEPVTISTQA